ncbi:alpha/beta hydrolase family protein [Rhodopirellula sallentina]|uniref:OsmC family protein n=1 Tax=Rhodopirellula sallentina SM41 TaxID=1263870 RepID=M5U9H2_9BACT|nr:alpha/beta fold hydrolase [Rhodopirellula sallentina]EMI57944.1 OsmC family protein [Rhodopirellula sallentina SM41]
MSDAQSSHTNRFERRSYRVRFENSQGIALAGIIDRPVRPADNAPSLESTAVPVAVFSHCFTCSKDLKAITRISRFLAETGIAVLRFDMTGLGGSDGEFSQTNFSTNLSDLTSAIEFANESIGPVTALIGHSFGGAASLAVAAGMPGRVQHTLSATLRDQISAVVSIAAPSDTQHLAALLTRLNPKLSESDQGDVVIGGRTWTITRQMLDDFRSHQLPDHLNRVRARVLAFHSPVDQTLGYDHALRIAGLIEDEQGLPGCSLITLSGADHLLTDDVRDADYVAELTANFLKRYASQ